MPKSPIGQYTRVISRFDQFPFQVQALRQEKWCVISCHATEKAANRGLHQIRKCRPGEPDLFRIVHQSAKDDYVWADNKNKPK
ncbi:MAG: hypothetical protein VXB01_09450 [Opitutae bacterium]